MSRAGAEPHNTIPTGAQVLDALPSFPGGAQLVEIGLSRGDVALVGGAVRDLLLARDPRELDVVVDSNSAQLAEELATGLQLAGAELVDVTAHQRFGTAVVSWDGGRVDIAERRAESYSAPGALPEVRAGSLAEDLARRDFTVNAIAVPLGGEQAGQLVCVEHALEDLAARRLRVLHNTSFIDDPTRLLRLARYSARLAFAPEQHTLSLAHMALTAGALDTVSRSRIGAELRLALCEADALVSLAELDRLGVLGAVGPQLRFDAELARRALELLPHDGRADVLLTAVVLSDLAAVEHSQQAMFELLDELDFTASERNSAIRTALGAPSIAQQLAGARSASRIDAVLCKHTVEAVALGAAMASPIAATALDWLQRLRHVQLEIGGDDLLAAGVPSGPEIGRRLAAVRALKLDGKIEDARHDELRAALQVKP